MSLWQSLVLGVIQGLTEFLPISSSGHLVLFQHLFGMKEPMMAFDVALHGATLLVVVVYFWKDVTDVAMDFWDSLQRKISKKTAPALPPPPPHHGLWVCILITLIPTGLIAVFFKDFFEHGFAQLPFVAVRWLIMGVLFILSQRFQKGQKDLSVISYGDAFWIGLAQGIALMPGTSRSGITILVGLWLGLRKDTAAKFSFLISIPAILAAMAMELRHGVHLFSSYPAQTFAGFLAALVTGYFVIVWLMDIVRKGRFYLFGYYCIAISLFTFMVLALSK
jgi:undecaprenyl-diphosphatase